MALIVEDGTGLETSNAYVSVSYVTEYLTERNRHTAWAALSTPIKEASIIKATDYIEMRFSKNFVGTKLVEDQSLSFPREYGSCETDYGLLPKNLLKASAELAVRAGLDTTTELITDDTSGLVKRKKEKVGPIEEDTEYENSFKTFGGIVSSDVIETYPIVDLLIEPLLTSSKGAISYR